MPKNALASRPTNALARQTDPLQSLLIEAAQAPQYGELVDYLSARRMMPPIVQKPLGAVGEFETPGLYGPEVPKTGVVSLSYRAQPQTAVHELTHAAQRQVEQQYYELERKSRDQQLTPQEQQFVKAYEKLLYTTGRMFGAKPESTQSLTAKRIAPEWAKSKSDYRATGSELAAFGMGSTVAPNLGYPAPLHVDPSYATEFSILLDLARKAQPVIPGR